ncbi:MAG: HAD family hydrolase [Desulfuromonadaceae bacterium]|nr:HAD family hydrolase [Geobacteraceae bacterium]
MPQLEVLVFDCDGVLFNSLAANIAFYNEILAHFGHEPMESAADERAGVCHIGSSPQVFAALLGEQRVEEALRIAAQIDYAKFFPKLIPEPGLYDALQHLAQRLTLAVATNRRGSMQGIVQHFNLEGYFTHLVTSIDVARPKPHPDMLWRVAELAGCEATKMVYVGDSEFDCQAAQEAGVEFFSYQWDGGTRIESHQHLVEVIEAKLTTAV